MRGPVLPPFMHIMSTYKAKAVMFTSGSHVYGGHCTVSLVVGNSISILVMSILAAVTFIVNTCRRTLLSRAAVPLQRNGPFRHVITPPGGRCLGYVTFHRNSREAKCDILLGSLMWRLLLRGVVCIVIGQWAVLRIGCRCL